MIKTFIINLEHRIDRRRHIINELTKVNITDYEFINATKVNINDCEFTKVKLAKISCFHSHVKALRKAYFDDLDQVLILEDDCFFNKYLDFIPPKEYPLFYLGCNLNIYKEETFDHTATVSKITDNIVELSECGTTHAIIYNKEFIDRIYYKFPTDEVFFNEAFSLDNFIDKIPIAYDDFLNFYCKIYNIKRYCIYPIICNQIESYSDLQSVNTNYINELNESWKHYGNKFNTSHASSHS